MAIPVFDIVHLSKSIAKVTLFVSFTVIFFTLLDNTVELLTVFLDSSFSLLDFSSIDFGCVSTILGLVDFLNSLIAQFYLVSSLVISSIGSLVTTKYILMFFGFLMRV